eukprot:CAMPEP_0184187568 /NCGR_PEP_ID=MMETSP0976-20121227/1004_1 /TAXON_ID=483370 /ORGANISM="non described non described, Strain CCMP2097" /LENGTH=85 /DNA_ID=CAMNT_0026491891 /DNA_START=1827 /DNA_END=2081 /DNA_ORIENTATION=-
MYPTPPSNVARDAVHGKRVRVLAEAQADEPPCDIARRPFRTVDILPILLGHVRRKVRDALQLNVRLVLRDRDDGLCDHRRHWHLA